MVLVWMADEQRIHIKTALRIPDQPIAEFFATSGVSLSGSSAAARMFISINIRWPASVWTRVMSPLPTGKNEIDAVTGFTPNAVNRLGSKKMGTLPIL